ncbi:ATPase AAA [Clostridia bacterium]|nr:ATPase AAA [Clostridia bacterium]
MTITAETLRPRTLADMVGQRHLIGEDAPLRLILDNTPANLPNMIFYGVPGVGKTTLANIIADMSDYNIHRLNGTAVSSSDIKAVLAQTNSLFGANGTLLYIDEIQYLNKKQQQILLEYTENGKITLIAATTENPYFYVYGALLSRSVVFEFQPVDYDDVMTAVTRAFDKAGVAADDNTNAAAAVIASRCGGDVRKAVNAALLVAQTGVVTSETAERLTQYTNMRYDKGGDEHYDIISAYQKSIRGSDENAALHYLARLLSAGDMVSAVRRLTVIAAEDIGLADPNAICVVNACVQAAERLGLPEARIPLAEAVIYLCTAPKSNSAVTAVDAALADVHNKALPHPPAHLRDTHYKGASALGRGVAKDGGGYVYPHDFPNNYVAQQYLPDGFRGRVYYEYGVNRRERAAEDYARAIGKK